MTSRWLDAALFIDLGEGREIKNGDRAGQIQWTTQPKARYECLRCETTDGPVTGPPAVGRFVATIRDAHICRTRGRPPAP